MTRVVAGVIERDGLVLIGQRQRSESFPLKWEFPGGKAEPGEEPRAALARELREELAIEAAVGEEMARYVHEYSGRPPIELIFYRVPRFTGDPVNLAFEQIRWAERRQLPDYDFLDGDVRFVGELAAEKAREQRAEVSGPRS